MSYDSLANLLTVALGGITAWMAWETRKMAAATREMAEIGAQPFLSFVSLDVQPANVLDPVTNVSAPVIRPVIKLANPGGVRVAYDVHELGFVLNGTP